MPVWQAVVYGVVQGLAEFLPISSSGHLALVPWLFGWEDPGLAFDVALHWGTLAAVLAVFWRDWIRILTKDHKLLWALVVSAVPGGILREIAGQRGPGKPPPPPLNPLHPPGHG